ncbi:hypothetical protein DACRYDRAFT_119524 [Dacryopinax primogenitus]|uniref:Uncharacterized protein n=1 Tax=Dacryopinax primogenitus (strain DJM 731) TaxID=1858805 RepID=M5G0W9_DACPD|nr:uncharacterized protein DACRYDRAFT_119524 [Dacryopinax primogenitus]EJT97432.1 hypothetical protein DACRYDRAFT_119524 [Dacryopinax primogenitus]
MDFRADFRTAYTSRTPTPQFKQLILLSFFMAPSSSTFGTTANFQQSTDSQPPETRGEAFNSIHFGNVPTLDFPSPAIPAHSPSASSIPPQLRAPRSVAPLEPSVSPVAILRNTTQPRIGGSFLRRLDATDGLSVNEERLAHAQQTRIESRHSTRLDPLRPVRSTSSPLSISVLVLPAPISGDSYFPVHARRCQYRGVRGDVFIRLLESLHRHNLLFHLDLSPQATIQQFTLTILSRMKANRLAFPTNPTPQSSSPHAPPFVFVRPSSGRQVQSALGRYKVQNIDQQQPLLRQLIKLYAGWKDTRDLFCDRLAVFIAPAFGSIIGPLSPLQDEYHRCFASFVFYLS